MEITQELKQKAAKTKNLEELDALAREEGVFLTRSELADTFSKTHPKIGELGDDELSDVAGGCPNDDKPDTRPSCCLCGTKDSHLNTTYIPNPYGTPKEYLVCDACWNRYPTVPDLWAALSELS